MKYEIDKKIENVVVLLTRLIHKKDLGKRTSALEKAIRLVVVEMYKK